MENDKVKALHVQVAEKLIEQLKAGTAPWQKPWSSDNLPAFELPYNAVTGNRYKGINTLSLLLNGYEDPRWMTFKQASANDWKVKKGEKASLIQFVKTSDLITKRDENGKPVLDGEGQPVKVSVKLDRPIITTAWVFNAAQINGIPPLQKQDIKALDWNPIERAEKLITDSGANISHQAGDRAFYSPLQDKITMPLKEQFDAPDKYYATLLHELGHWTGHKDRLDRGMVNTFGTEAYAREELRAEIASLLIGQELRIGHDPAQHTAYVDSWIKVLQDTPFEIHAAAADAEKIFDYLTGLEQKREIKETAEPVRKDQSPDHDTGPKHLTIGDKIAYSDTVFKVQSHLKQGRLRMEDLGTGNNFILSRNDMLYQSLLHAKQHPDRQPHIANETEIAMSREPETVTAYRDVKNYNPLTMETLIKEKELPIRELEKLGLYQDGKVTLSPENLDALLAGRRTDMLSMDHLKMEGFEIRQLDAKLSLSRREDGTVALNLHPIYKEVKMHPLLNKEEAEKLLTGSLQSVLKDNKPTEKKPDQLVIEYDQQTREFVTYRPDQVEVPEKVNGETLSEQQKKAFQNGELVKLRDGTRIQHSATDSKGIRSDTKRLILSVLLDGGISYLLFRGIRNLVGNESAQKEGYTKGYNQALADMMVGKSKREMEMTVGEQAEYSRASQQSRGYGRTGSR